MITAVSSSWALFLGMALLMIGNGLQGSLLGVRASIEQFPTTVTGILMSAFYFGFLVSSIMTPKLVARVGHVRVFAALASLASTAILVHAVSVNPLSWILMRLVSGFAYAGLYVVAESWLNEQASNETRGQLLSFYMVVSTGGMALGQVFLNLADPGEASLFILVSILVSVALIPLLLSQTRGPVMETPTAISLKEVYAASPTGLVAAFGVGILQGGSIGMGAVYAGLLGYSVAEISLFMTALLLGSACFQWIIGWISDRYDRRLVLTAVTFLAACLAMFANVVDLSFNALLVIAFLFGGMMFPMYSLAIAYANDHLRHDQMVGASGTLVLVSGAGAFLGPTLVAAAIDSLGPAGFFWSLGGVHALIGLFILYRMTQRSALPADEQGTYAMMPRTTGVVAGMFGEEAVSENYEGEDGEQAPEQADQHRGHSVSGAAPAAPPIT